MLLDDPVKGVVPVTYRTVRDPAVSGGIVVQVKDGSNPYWLQTTPAQLY